MPTREIMWNVSHPAHTIMMYLVFVISLIVLGRSVYHRVLLWCGGRPSPGNTGNYLARFNDAVSWVLMQRGVSREREAGLAHMLVYFGFLVLTFTTTMVMLDHDFGIKIYHGNFYLAVTVLSDIFGLGLMIGIGAFAYRRLIARPDLIHTRPADWIMLGVLFVLCLQGYLLEGFRIKVTNDPWALYSPVGWVVSKFFWGVPDQILKGLHLFTWWFHALTFFVAFALLPYTKFFHIISSSLNLYFRRSDRPRGALPFPGDIEKLMETEEEVQFGTSSIKDYTWKMLLDLDACTSCGRCQNVCPAYMSGKPLSPKWLILDSRNHMLALNSDKKFGKNPSKTDSYLLQNLLLAKSGVQKTNGTYSANGSHRGANSLVQESAKLIGNNADDELCGTVIDSDVFWSCNTCYACVEACPVGINHVDHIVENRRSSVLMRGEMPHEAQSALRTLESTGNPLGSSESRTAWAKDLELKILKPGDSVDYLYWVGCISAFDPRKQAIARSLVKIMNKAGLSFGILGDAEGCSGDPARRLGEENLFQALAKGNIETLKSIKFKTLVANCPHCFNTIKNEYPQLGNLGDGKSPQIIHHSVLLKQLLADGKISLSDSDEEITFHDPCYLGRYNGEYDAPRDTLKKIKGLKIVEMEHNKEKGLCCGAGGGHFWMDLKIGERVNVIRANQAKATGASSIATGCPFCLQMMEDGNKLIDSETPVRDIAEVLAERV